MLHRKKAMSWVGGMLTFLAATTFAGAQQQATQSAPSSQSLGIANEQEIEDLPDADEWAKLRDLIVDRPEREGDQLQISVTALGDDSQTLEGLREELSRHELVREQLQAVRSRLLTLELLESTSGEKKPQAMFRPSRYRAHYLDYTNGLSVIADGQLGNRDLLKVTRAATQPLPTTDEFLEAVKILAGDARLAKAIREKRIRPYQPMPPLVNTVLVDGRVERTLAVGLMPLDDRAVHEIVGVNLVRRSVLHYHGNAPPTAVATSSTCQPPPSANQSTTPKGTPGAVRVRVSQGTTLLWQFDVVRPSASSGTNGSGIELRFVNYRGRRVLYRAHAPILNVRYDGNACGPYRDWQWQEGMIQANGTDVAPGFRLCPAPATTIIDSGTDTGNFLGTAIYVDGQEVVLVNEMQAGWYRYVSEWRLHADGTIRPRFGFDGVQNSCTCLRHHHHVYWRLDFDINTASNNIVRELDGPASSPTSCQSIGYETQRPRAPAIQRRWIVANKSAGNGYLIVPGATDGVATASPDWPFPRGDVWVLRYRGTEIDDGVPAIGPPYEAGLDGFVNGEDVNGRDVVVWYAGHFTHDETSGEDVAHIVGPDLRPVTIGDQEETPRITRSPSRINFGRIPINDIETRSVTIRNSGCVDVQVSFPQRLTRPFLWNGLNTVIPPGDERRVIVEFAPNGPGLAQTTLQINSNASGSPHTVELRGTGFVGEPR